MVTAKQAAELDGRTIAGGVTARTLMLAAGRAAAALVLERFPLEAARGVAVFAGPGNNGGDAWVVAGELARRGVRVRVAQVSELKSADAIAARDDARAHFDGAEPSGDEGLIVDGLLGTGAAGTPHGSVADAIGRIAALTMDVPGSVAAATRRRVVALDIPSGVDASTGAVPGAFVRADLTVTFGTLKRGLLVNRDAAGTIVVVDIGLAGGAAHGTEAPLLMDAATVVAFTPRIAADAHKGTRKRLAVVGGAPGMAGATVLAARAAMRSGIGMVKLFVAPESLGAVQAAEPAAMAAEWPQTDAERDALFGWAHALLVGPGIGTSARARGLVWDLIAAWSGPVVLDADALRIFEQEPAKLRTLLAADGRQRGSPAVITPHAVEFARLAGVTAEEVNARRFDIAGELARTVGATVLLKGVPSVVSDGVSSMVSASGTPVLATAGSGDLLSGIVATLLAQTGDALQSAAAAAWIHGRAAEIAGAGQVRGVTLDDVLDALRAAWRLADAPIRPPLLAELHAVADRGP